MDELRYTAKQIQHVLKCLDEIKGVGNAQYVLMIASLLNDPLPVPTAKEAVNSGNE
jgi:hypothetical protein